MSDEVLHQERYFVHPDGRTYHIALVDFRVHEMWRTATKSGGATTAVRADAADARKHADKKVKELLKKGFVETESAGRRIDIDTTVDVIDAFHSNLNFEGKRRDDYQPGDVPHLFTCANISVRQWLVTSDDRRLGIEMRGKSAAPAAIGDAMAREVLARREELLADRTTPVRKLPLSEPIGGLTHLLVTSPGVTNRTISQNVNIQSHVLALSIFEAILAYDCEMIGTEPPGMVEARLSGRGSIPYTNWNRAPHPVVDLASPPKRGEPDFKVYPPDQLEQRLGTSALAKLKDPELLARNWRGEIRRFARGESTDLTDLRAFFGFVSKP